jgi:methylmalonyl-CoA/ethylmalonyl-CoA epimerase
LKEITEVGVAVKDLEKTTRLLVDILGGEAGEVVDMPMFGMRFCMVRLGNVDFELMEPTDDEGMIARFIRTKGEGIHHVAFSVDRLSEEIARLKEKGCELINSEPLEILGGKVSFLHPRSFSGVAIELVEYPQGWKGWIVPRSEKDK